MNSNFQRGWSASRKSVAIHFIFRRSSHLYWLVLSLSLIWFGVELTRRLDVIHLPWADTKVVALGVLVALLLLFFRRRLRRNIVTGLLAAGALLVAHSVGIALTCPLPPYQLN